MDNPKQLYECLLDYCDAGAKVTRTVIGPVWTVCQSETKRGIHSGLAMSPVAPTRTLQWPGTLSGQVLKEIGRWLLSWEPYQATVGMAAVNCSINNGRYLPDGELLPFRQGAGNLTVFEHFLEQTQNQKVVVIGHYPGIETYCERYGWRVLERAPVAGDYPDPAAEFLLPEADWVFISASTLPNKTFPRLAELAASAKTVLMGPTVPWFPEWRRFGIDYLAGVEVVDSEALYQTVAEGGGVRIFETGVRYKVVELGTEVDLVWLKRQIGDTFEQKSRLTQAMDQWYGEGHTRRFPQYAELDAVNRRLSRLDSAYKTLWDQQQTVTGSASAEL